MKKDKKDRARMLLSALGELYQLGLAGLLKSATDLRSVTKEQKK